VEPTKLIAAAFSVSIFLIVAGFALEASWQDITFLFKRPDLLGRSLLAMSVIMPIVTALLIWKIDFNPHVEVALVLLAVSPVFPGLAKKAISAGGDRSYAYGLLAMTALVSIALVPISIAVLSAVVGKEISMSAATVARVVLMSILAPLVLGVLVRHFAPAFADRIKGPVSLLGVVLLLLGYIPMLVLVWPAFLALFGHGTLVAIATIAIVSLAVGHFLGGPESHNRTVLALATALRHPAVALSIAAANGADKLVSAAILLYVLVSAVLSIPYTMWRKRSEAVAAS
jgi:bile acid:Na+ symporter, BASS family